MVSLLSSLYACKHVTLVCFRAQHPSAGKVLCFSKWQAQTYQSVSLSSHLITSVAGQIYPDDPRIRQKCSLRARQKFTAPLQYCRNTSQQRHCVILSHLTYARNFATSSHHWNIIVKSPSLSVKQHHVASSVLSFPGYAVKQACGISLIPLLHAKKFDRSSIFSSWRNLSPAATFSLQQNFFSSSSFESLGGDSLLTPGAHATKTHEEIWTELKNSDDETLDTDTTDSVEASHVPVMVEEVLQVLQPENGQVIVDMTFGAGGHAQEILKVAPEVHYIASDRDPLAHSNAKKFAEEHRQGQIIPVLSKFSEIPTHLLRHGIQPGTVDAFLFDLGASSMQFDVPERGFSLSKDGPLDMRMDGNRFPDSATAADVVNSLDPHDLAHILKKYGEEKRARQIAHAIVEARYAFGNFTRTKQLADVVKTVFNSGAFRHDKMFRHAHVATKTFQALRIFVNDELNEVHNGLEIARHFLRPGGCCVVLSFHSLEDRIVKRHFHDIDIDEAANKSIHDHFRNANVSFDVEVLKDEFLTKPWRPVSRKVMEASDEECQRNPRARSAKLRAAFKQNVEPVD